MPPRKPAPQNRRAPTNGRARKAPAPDRRARNIVLFTIAWVSVIYLLGWSDVFGMRYSREETSSTTPSVAQTTAPTPQPVPVLDTKAYDAKMLSIANYPPITASTSSSTIAHRLWPAKGNPYPEAGALLPFKRIVAYYGNFYSTNMGVLGEYDAPTMLAKLRSTVAQWNAADPSTPAIPAIDYIVDTAQGSPGKEGYYMLRMPDDQVDHALDLANQVNGIVILDVQVGLSNLQRELPLLDKYLAMPNVELAIDPEFSMKDGAKPGTEIGTFDATDVNYAAQHLAALVQQHNLPPKVLIVHRFTQDMVTNYQNIQPLPQVEIVMDMDGWGSQAKKLNTYQQFIATQPVQFTGFKLFYKNDLKPPSTGMLTPQQLLKLTPQPLFIQYQ